MSQFTQNEDIPIGCNLVMWDFIFVALGVGFSLYNYLHVHPVFCILLAIVTGGLFLFLLSIKYLGFILKVLLGAAWSIVILSLATLIDFVDKLIEDPIWLWSILIMLFIICTMLHFMAADSLSSNQAALGNTDNPYSKRTLRPSTHYAQNITEEASSASAFVEKLNAIIQKYNSLEEEFKRNIEQGFKICEENNCPDFSQDFYTYYNQVQNHQTEFQQFYNKVIDNSTSDEQREWCYSELARHVTDIEHANKNMSHKINEMCFTQYSSTQQHTASSANDIDESLFNGCTDRDSLTKRYRNLMKTFHPDTGNGDVAMTQKIQRTYDELLKRL